MASAPSVAGGYRAYEIPSALLSCRLRTAPPGGRSDEAICDRSASQTVLSPQDRDGGLKATAVDARPEGT